MLAKYEWGHQVQPYNEQNNRPGWRKIKPVIREADKLVAMLKGRYRGYLKTRSHSREENKVTERSGRERLEFYLCKHFPEAASLEGKMKHTGYFVFVLLTNTHLNTSATNSMKKNPCFCYIQHINMWIWKYITAAIKQETQAVKTTLMLLSAF